MSSAVYYKWLLRVHLSSILHSLVSMQPSHAPLHLLTVSHTRICPTAGISKIDWGKMDLQSLTDSVCAADY